MSRFTARSHRSLSHPVPSHILIPSQAIDVKEVAGLRRLSAISVAIARQFVVLWALLSVANQLLANSPYDTSASGRGDRKCVAYIEQN